MVNSPAGIITICGQAAQSLNCTRALGTLNMTGGAERRCCCDRASRRADATSAAVSGFERCNLGLQLLLRGLGARICLRLSRNRHDHRDHKGQAERASNRQSSSPSNAAGRTRSETSSTRSKGPISRPSSALCTNRASCFETNTSVRSLTRLPNAP
jgi:hypothetical protein